VIAATSHRDVKIKQSLAEKGKYSMLELIFLFVILPRKIRKLAKERDRSALKWGLAAIGAWIGTELAVSVFIVVLLFVSSAAWGVPQNPESVSGLAYVPALLAALIASEIVVRRLRRVPKRGEEVIAPPGPPMPWEQGLGPGPKSVS
jgi:hypothetical protein